LNANPIFRRGSEVVEQRLWTRWLRIHGIFDLASAAVDSRAAQRQQCQ
jgi:hypothetical protein